MLPSSASANGWKLFPSKSPQHMQRRARAIKLDLLTAVERARAGRGAHARLAYIGGHGSGNAGDDAIYEAAEQLFPDSRLLTYHLPAREGRLARVGLGGKKYFRRLLIGGGTFLNDSTLVTVRAALEQGLPVATLGTGAGSMGLNMPRRVDLSAWTDLMAHFDAIGVRGPVSKAALENAGVSRVEVVGDLALLHSRPERPERAETRRFAVSAAQPFPRHVEGFSLERLDELGDAVSALMKRGWEPVFVAMDAHDEIALAHVKSRVTAGHFPTLHPGTTSALLDLFDGCAFTLAIRLHAAVLSTCVGTPSLMLGYRDKCLDFMASLGLEAWHVDLFEPKPDIVTKALELAEAAQSLRQVVLSSSLEMKARLEAYAARLRASSHSFPMGFRPG